MQTVASATLRTSPAPVARRALLTAVASFAAGAHALGAKAATGQAAPYRLVPSPREMRPLPPLGVAQGVSISAAAGDQLAAEDLGTTLRARGVRVGAGGLRVTLARATSVVGREALRRAGVQLEPAMHEEGYVLVAGCAARVASDCARVDVVAESDAGVFYGVQTLKQLLDGSGQGARILGAIIRDWPAMRYRGLHDDLSRGPVPTLEFQKQQIRTFAAYKLNVYSPYFEHTLSYASTPLAAPPGGALTREQITELVAYARRYHVDVVPEQEAFGHLHHVLKLERYAALAETPHGHVLAPGQPGSVPLIRQWFAELDSLFPSRFVHLGADETFELGRGQTADRVRTEGIGAVYLGFLRQIADALRGRGKRFLFWGDVAMNHPELVKTLPPDMIAVAWEYDPAPAFDRLLRPFVDARMETWVAPGVNNWNRVYPNYDLALRNIQGFVRDGQRLGSTGVLTTTWDDDGEALFSQTWYGVLFGAAASWQPGASSIEAFQSSFGRVFHGDTTGRVDEAQRKLMAAHALLRQAGLGDASDFLFWVDPYSSEGQLVAETIRPVASQLRLLAEDALELLARAPRPLREEDALRATELGARRIDFIGQKFQLADEVVQLYARAADPSNQTPARELGDLAGINGRLQDLRDGYSLLRDEYETAWRRENRPYWLHNVLARYDLSTQRWIERLDRVVLARRTWTRTKRLPPAADLGIPATMPGLR